MKKIKWSAAILMGLGLFASCVSKPTQKKVEQKPNIIYFLVDDMGYGDLGCYGQTKFETPNLDQLAAEGIKFTQHYCGTAVCAPSRSSLLTGQHTGHTYIRGNKELHNEAGDAIEGQAPLTAENITIAEVLKSAGYTTGCFGKWGLGVPGSEGDPLNQGFDEFLGANCQRMAHSFYPPYLWHNDEKLMLEGNDWTQKKTYAADVMQNGALNFIKENKDKPFFAYVACTLPHAELISPKDSIWAMFDGKYADDEVPYDLSTNPNYTMDYGPGKAEAYWKYCSQEQPLATYASMVYRMDAYMGQIMEQLENLGIDDNTIIMFASDNGPHTEGGAVPAFFNSYGPLRGVKRDLYEGGIRTAFITRWPAKIPAGSVSDHISAFWDVMPTLADAAGIELEAEGDGISFLPTLLGNTDQQKKHDHMYWELNVAGGRVAARWNNWKGVVYKVEKAKNPTFELYDLSTDLGETNNVAANHPDVVKHLKEIIMKEHMHSELFPFEVARINNN
ncbi:arylsulfatase [Saccharicrinis aurantiacus]|uniref:arylsulfatase n=1 Tax=Saccharicrinis aurantiacus TaxID=1849719 RepID=UPI000839A147|nr:arylsulfatase [Saccharicrinis aurantiacus]